jgi:predicted aspartyl protease
MPAYDDGRFSPPAPVGRAELRNSQTGKTESEISMLLDSGADVTLLPKSVVESLGIERSDVKYELIAFDGTKSLAEAVHAELVFLGRTFRGQFLLTDQEIGILGRDVLTHVSLLLDGPRFQWEEPTSR